MSNSENSNEPCSSTESSRFNYIYSRLVPEPYDFVGLCAYSIYKQEKIAYIVDWRNRNGREPSPEDLQDFHIQSMTRCDQYRELAVSKVAKFGQELIEEKIKAIDDSYRKEASTQKWYAWWIGVFQSLTASFIFALLIGIIIVILIGVKFGFTEILKMLIEMLSLPSIRV